MLANVLKQLNWVDFFALIVLFRIGYVARKSGFSAELFKLLGTLLSTYLSLHYYLIFSDYLGNRIGIQDMLLEYSTSFIFIAFAILGYLVFVVLRNIFYRFLKMEAVPNLDQWGGLILGLVRAVLLASLIIFIMVTSPLVYLKDSVTSSYSGKAIFKVAPAVYSGLWKSIASKFATQEKFNKAILEVPKSLESRE
ncbi:MAG: CvpA family protein [Candidatus Omnitrophota bacterium]